MPVGAEQCRRAGMAHTGLPRSSADGRLVPLFGSWTHTVSRVQVFLFFKIYLSE